MDGGQREDNLHLLRQMTDELSLDEGNAVVRKHFRIENLVIAIVTDDVSALKAALVSDVPSPISYPQPASAKIVEGGQRDRLSSFEFFGGKRQSYFPRAGFHATRLNHGR